MMKRQPQTLIAPMSRVRAPSFPPPALAGRVVKGAAPEDFGWSGPGLYRFFADGMILHAFVDDVPHSQRPDGQRWLRFSAPNCCFSRRLSPHADVCPAGEWQFPLELVAPRNQGEAMSNFLAVAQHHQISLSISTDTDTGLRSLAEPARQVADLAATELQVRAFPGAWERLLEEIDKIDKGQPGHFGRSDDDPIFAAIERHQVATLDVMNEEPQNSLALTPAMKAEEEAWEHLCLTLPNTTAGRWALDAYLDIQRGRGQPPALSPAPHARMRKAASMQAVA